ncbi:MAG: prolyl oligopeptidase family serine peptidase [Longimicrobiales bacterium]
MLSSPARPLAGSVRTRTAATCSHRRSAALCLALSLVTAGPAASQTAPRPLTLDDYGAWSRIAEVELAPDGRWMTYAYQPNDGDAAFHVRALDGQGLHEAVNGSDAAFSADGRWVAFLVSPAEEDAEAAREADRPVRRALHTIDLRSGERREDPGVRSFAFSDDGRFLAALRDRADPKAEHRGADLLLRDLTAGTLLNLGNVSEFAFNDPGTHMAYVVDAADGAGNGLYVVTPADGRVRPVDVGGGRYEDLAWNHAGTAVAVLRGETPEGSVHRANALVVARGLSGPALERTVYEPSAANGMPAGFVLSEMASTAWLADDSRVVVGIKAQEADLDDPDGEQPNVDVWHWMDDELQSRQIVTADADRRFTYTSVVDPAAGRLVRLATDAMPRVDFTDDGSWAIGRRDEPYRWDYDAEGGRADYVRIDPADGSERVFAEAVRRPLGASPDGSWYLYAQDEEVFAVDLRSLATTNLTEVTGIDFMNREFDVVAERPAHGVGGWTEDGRVLLYTRYDIHAVDPADGSVEAVTGGAGTRDEIRYRVERIDPEADWVDPDGALLSAYGEWTKHSGYVRARPGRDPQALLFGDEMIDDVEVAADADRVVFTRQTFERFPDYWTADADFASPRQVTDANPQRAEFAWGRRVLVDYTDDRGNRLQATLALPAGYEEGRRYPMVVYFYEKMSQRHHQFSLPVYDDRPHMSTYASNGYLVLMPDIVYDDGLPGMSALDDVTAATERVIELGYADPERIGLQGHSWGGYQSSFIVTQTDLFAAVVTGAPLTNLMSMYNINYKRTGGGNGPILEWSQGRFGVTPWDDFELYTSQSPVHHADKITTPFMILHGTDDGAVDWNQGLEFFNAARRLGKEVILLSYPGEPHHLAQEANQKDFQVRMRQYFDHHLLGVEAPEWMTRGVPFLDKGKARPRVIS